MSEFPKFSRELRRFFKSKTKSKTTVAQKFIQETAWQFSEIVTTNERDRDTWLKDRLLEVTSLRGVNDLSNILKGQKNGTLGKPDVAFGLYFLAKVDDDYEMVVAPIERALFGGTKTKPVTFKAKFGWEPVKLVSQDYPDDSGALPPSYPKNIRLGEANLNGRKEFKEFWADPHLVLPPKVRLGPISISIGYIDGLFRLVTNDRNGDSVSTNGQPDIFKALGWRSRLTRLHGRQDEFDHLRDWALRPDDGNSRQPEIMLVSGPGGSGKSRLVADVVDHLVEECGWAGGLLPRGIGRGDVIDGSGSGVALIIDYPEERTKFVAEILAAARNQHDGGCPIRIILVSRENLVSWEAILNEPNPYWISEIFLGEAPYLSVDHASDLIFDVLDAYPGKIKVEDLETPEVDAVDQWLEQHYSHRLPLIALAAAVHAVLEPDEAFCLGGDQVLLALAGIELKRVRKYSERNLKDESILEILLALSLMTDTGLSSNSVFSIGNTGIWPSHNGASLLGAIQRTPFWVQADKSDDKFLEKFEPDLFAAAFLHLALNLKAPLPYVPNLIAYAIQQCGPDFASILARLSLDVGQISAPSSRMIEDLAVAALDASPDIVETVKDVAYSETSTFSAEFVVGVCKKVLISTNEPELRAALQNSIGNRLSDLGRREEALRYAADSVTVFEQLSDADPVSYLPDLAMALNNQGNRLSDMGLHEEAVVENARSVKTYERLAKGGSGTFRADLANALHNLSSVYSDLGKIDEALKAAQTALRIRQDLVTEDRPRFLPDLAMSYNNLGNIFADQELYIEALAATEKALNLHQELAGPKPETFRSLVANSFVNLSIRNGDLMRDGAALDAAKDAIRIYEQLAELRPDSYSEDLAGALNNLALRYTISGQETKAVESAELAIEIFRPLAEEFPNAFSPDMALSLNNLAASLINLEAFEDALPNARKAVSLHDDMDEPNASKFLSDRGMAENNLSEILCALKKYDEALHHVNNAETIFRDLFDAGRQNHLPDLALSLNNAGTILKEMKRYQEATVKTVELVQVARSLTDSDENIYELDLAYSLSTLSSLYLETKNHDEAADYITEAMDIVASMHIDRLQGYVEWIRAIRKAYFSAHAAHEEKPQTALLKQIDQILERLHDVA